MGRERDLEAEFDAEVTVDRTASGREGVAEFTVTCDRESTTAVRERIEELGPEIVFETR